MVVICPLSVTLASAPLLQHPDEVRGTEDRHPSRQLQQVAIARNQRRTLGMGEGQEVVVAWVSRTQRWGAGGVGHEQSPFTNPAVKLRCVRGRHAGTKLGATQDIPKLGEKQSGHDGLVVPCQPPLEHLRWCTSGRDHRGDDDVRVEDRAQPSAVGAPRGVLLCHRKLHGSVRLHVGLAPQPVEQVQAEIAAHGPLDDLAVAYAMAGGVDLHST